MSFRSLSAIGFISAIALGGCGLFMGISDGIFSSFIDFSENEKNIDDAAERYSSVIKLMSAAMILLLLSVVSYACAERRGERRWLETQNSNSEDQNDSLSVVLLSRNN